MTTRRLVTAFVIALLVSGMFTLYLSQKFTKSKPPAAPKNQYVAAVSGFEAGQVIRPENLKLIDWPTNVPLQGAFATVEGLAGRTVLYPLAPGEPLLERQLSAPGAGSGLTTKIPEGMRAISLRSDEIVGVAGFLLPGAHVDVLVTLRSGTTPDPVTSTVLQDVEVLATGQKMQPDPEGKPTTTTVVTLLVKPEDAEKVVLASSMGSVHFVLRNGTDRETVDGQPMQLSGLGGAVPVAPAPTAKAEPKRISVDIAKPYTVETILGAKQRTDSFQ